MRFFATCLVDYYIYICLCNKYFNIFAIQFVLCYYKGVHDYSNSDNSNSDNSNSDNSNSDNSNSTIQIRTTQIQTI